MNYRRMMDQVAIVLACVSAITLGACAHRPPAAGAVPRATVDVASARVHPPPPQPPDGAEGEATDTLDCGHHTVFNDCEMLAAALQMLDGATRPSEVVASMELRCDVSEATESHASLVCKKELWSTDYEEVEDDGLMEERERCFRRGLASCFEEFGSWEIADEDARSGWLATKGDVECSTKIFFIPVEEHHRAHRFFMECWREKRQGQ